MAECVDSHWKLIAEFNRTARDFPDDVTLHELFERQALRHGSRRAVLCHHDSFWGEPALTFAQLNEKANHVARRLQHQGVRRGEVVGLLAERSFAMVIGVFGILKAGAAYLPLSPDDPADRLTYVLTDAGVKTLLVHRATASKAPAGPAIIDLESMELYAGPGTNLGRISLPRDLAYVIYTSGSTGRPKGVMIEHRSVVNRLHWMQQAYPIGEGDVLLQKTPYCFDVSVWELFWWALEGATLTLLSPRGERSPQVLLEAARRDRVSVMHFVPSMLNVFLEYLSGRPEKVRAALPSVQRVFASGETLSPVHVRKFNATIGQITGCRLTNLYGPTEATVDATYFDCPPQGEFDRIPIGRPIQNLQAHILRGAAPVPIGEIGELCLAGVGLARGYLNNAALTREKFPQNPLAPDERIYRTGDLARWLPDGNIEYLGREDHQVKIRGLRIELEEIENCLRRSPGVSDCVVVTKQYSESILLLVAYYVAKENLPVDALKRDLARQLPDYMVPDRFEKIAAIPLTASGKADRKALPELTALRKAS
jgi:amino acid adenylation domain-containing protein